MRTEVSAMQSPSELMPLEAVGELPKVLMDSTSRPFQAGSRCRIRVCSGLKDGGLSRFLATSTPSPVRMAKAEHPSGSGAGRLRRSSSA